MSYTPLKCEAPYCDIQPFSCTNGFALHFIWTYIYKSLPLKKRICIHAPHVHATKFVVPHMWGLMWVCEWIDWWHIQPCTNTWICDTNVYKRLFDPSSPLPLTTFCKVKACGLWNFCNGHVVCFLLKDYDSHAFVSRAWDISHTHHIIYFHM